jgi:hypothetical protein
MDESLARRLCRLAEADLPTPEAVSRAAGANPEVLRDIAENYEGSATSQGNALIRKAAADALEALAT